MKTLDLMTRATSMSRMMKGSLETKSTVNYVSLMIPTTCSTFLGTSSDLNLEQHLHRNVCDLLSDL